MVEGDELEGETVSSHAIPASLWGLAEAELLFFAKAKNGATQRS